MKLTIPPVQIDPTKPFNHDLFKREEFGEGLANLILKFDEPLVISIDAPWGEGKTTFVKMWKGLLDQKKIPAIYVDAFAHDYLDDPFMTVVGAINQYAEENTQQGQQTRMAEFKEKSIKVGGKLLSVGAKLAAKGTTLGLVGESEWEGFKDIQKALSNEAAKGAEEFVKHQLESHKEAQNVVKSFKASLEDLPEHLGDGQNPLVIIIDELDRCKPTFAVELIEKIKHLFLVPKIVFVLVMNKEQLMEAIRFVYGQNIKAHTYLQKFITIETQLPKKSQTQFIASSEIWAYAEHLFKQHQLGSQGRALDEVGWLILLSVSLNLSLREVEKAMSLVTLYVATSSNNPAIPLRLVGALAVIKVKLPDLFAKLSNSAISGAELFESLPFPKGASVNEIIKRDWVRMNSVFETFLLTDNQFQKLTDKDKEDRDQYLQWLYAADLGRLEAIPYLTDRLRSFVGY